MANGEKDILLINEGTYVGMYDFPKYVNLAVDRLIEFFNKNLK